ncbi:GNAT family N-acetyltransferase [Alicyclobacillus dauci]|uniref:GNAT family N-acetyltransferase n=1 Tax=Alicyclobacillus dauci TaxID=1475485 RepID=A0ABY6YZP4_9BACL|nr:GNAT family N-acetyltransferase [Alicyclobacillus dauci]WAH36105.1 GNAT family N-acetyltransferase [Alicyclobacillus dauci]
MIRSFNNADAEYMVNSHYDIYQREYGYDLSFKEFIENSVNDFVDTADRNCEHIWILDLEGKQRGSIGLTRVNEATAQLRLFLIDPEARGFGFGGKLVKQAIDFARSNKYKKIILWTNSDLKSARHLYNRFGFKLVERKTSTLSNQILTEERWELPLQDY